VDPQVLYPHFTSGNWCQFTDTIFFNLSETDSLANFGVTDGSNRNMLAETMPIKEITRAEAEVIGGKAMALVTYLNPRAASVATITDQLAPEDGFFTPVAYKGAFSPHANWLNGWTAAYTYGMTD
jgi:hypothetical protein